MNKLPHTSERNYITGKAALNVPNADGSFADWHFDEVFLSGRGKIRISGIDTLQTNDLLGEYGIWECGSVLRRFGVPIAENEKVYSANHIRALLDMVLTAISKKRIPAHVNIHDVIDSEQEIFEFQKQVSILKQKIQDKVTLSLLTQWEQTQL